MISPFTQLLELFSLGQSQLVSLATTLNGDAYVIGGQLISAANNGGSLLLLGLSQAAASLPSLPSFPSLPGV